MIRCVSLSASMFLALTLTLCLSGLGQSNQLSDMDYAVYRALKPTIPVGRPLFFQTKTLIDSEGWKRARQKLFGLFPGLNDDAFDDFLRRADQHVLLEKQRLWPGILIVSDSDFESVYFSPIGYSQSKEQAFLVVTYHLKFLRVDAVLLERSGTDWVIKKRETVAQS